MAKIEALTAKQVSALGRIAVGHAHLDGLLEAIIGVLAAVGTGREDQERARIIVQGQSTSWLTQCVERLAPLHPDLKADLIAWAKGVRATAAERNRVMHAIWLIRTGKQTSAILRRRIKVGMTVELVTLDHLLEIVARLDELQEMGYDLAAKLAAPPTPK